MVFEGVFVLGHRGLSVIELLVAIVSILAATSAPWMTTSWRKAALKVRAEELAAGLNRARQLAISQNRRVCVEVASHRYRYWLNGCGEELRGRRVEVI